MEKTINVGGKELKLKATAKTLRLYRSKFERDLLVDMRTIINDIAANKKITADNLETFENVIYVMAMQADEDIPSNIGEWLDSYEPLEIYKICPDVLELWNASNKTHEEVKKKQNRRRKR